MKLFDQGTYESENTGKSLKMIDHGKVGENRNLTNLEKSVNENC